MDLSAFNLQGKVALITTGTGLFAKNLT